MGIPWVYRFLLGDLSFIYALTWYLALANEMNGIFADDAVRVDYDIHRKGE